MATRPDMVEHLRQIGQTGQIVNRSEIIDMGHDCPDTTGFRLEPFIAQEGIEPDQTPAALVQPLDLLA